MKKVQENSGSDIRDGTSNDLMMDKMKTEQDKALNFLRLCIITQVPGGLFTRSRFQETGSDLNPGC